MIRREKWEEKKEVEGEGRSRGKKMRYGGKRNQEIRRKMDRDERRGRDR